MGRGVIFDVDGTLVDSNRAHAESWAKTLTKFGQRCQPMMSLLIGYENPPIFKS